MSKSAPSKSVVKRPSRFWGLLRALGFGLQLSLALAFVSFGIRSYLARTRLQAALAQMDRTDPGWRLQDVEAARATVPDEENSALRVIDLGQRLSRSSKPWIEEDFATELQQIPPERRMTADQFAHLNQRLNDVGPILDDARALKDFPRGRFPIVYPRNPLNTMLEGQQKSRRVLQLLTLDATARAESGDAHGAMMSCRAALNVGRSLGDEPTAISQLIRVAEAMIACKTAGRVLAETEPADDDLKDLQKALEDEDEFSYWDVMLRGERALNNALLEALESGDVTLSELADSRPGWDDRVLGFAYQDYVRSIHPQLFTYTARLEAAGEMPAKVRGQALQQIMRQSRGAPPNPVTLVMAAYPKLADAFARCHATLRCTVTALAAERYRRLHGDWPQSLDRLTPDFLAAVPDDPFTDEPLIYRRQADGVAIYSVGPDGKDDGGLVLVPSPTEPGTDLGIRLWDVSKRRQPPAPPH